MVTTNLPFDDHQPGVGYRPRRRRNLPSQGMDRSLRLGTAHRRAAGPAHPPRPHPGDERRELPPQAQQGERCSTSPWLSLSGEENHYYWWYYYDDDDNSRVPNPMMKFYRSNGQPVVMNGDTIEDQLGSGTRRFNLPRLRLIPMPMTPTTCACRHFRRYWQILGIASITSSRGDRNSSNCHSGRTHANCKLHAAGTHIEGSIKWADVDTYKVTYRKGESAPALTSGMSHLSQTQTVAIAVLRPVRNQRQPQLALHN